LTGSNRVQPEESSRPDASARRTDGGVTRRSLAIAIFLTLITGLWVRQSEVVVLATQITESVPAIPALASLVLLVAASAALRRSKRVRPLSRGEILFVFFFLAISSTVMGVGVTQFLLGIITTPFYYPRSHLEANRALLPGWLVPHNPEVMRQFYERAPGGHVPWAVWIPPGMIWLGFFLALWTTLYCMMALFYRAWSEEERLAFPLVTLVTEMAGADGKRQSFFRNRAMWAGFGVAALYNLVNIVHAFVPSAPAFGPDWVVTRASAAPPWNAFGDLKFYLRPEIIGLGFLVSKEISLTVWVSFVAIRLMAVWGAMHGAPPGDYPYPQEQGMGAYMVLACSLIWLARKRIGRALRTGQSRDEMGPEGLKTRTQLAGFLIGATIVWLVMTAAGIGWWVALAYLVLVLAVALVYGRLRAETGVPLIWLFPYSMAKNVLLYSFGSAPFVASGRRTMSVWALFMFMSRGDFPELTGYQLEAMELTRRTGLNARRLVFAGLFAVALGFVVGWYIHLTPYYRFGSANLREGSMWNFWLIIPEYSSALRLRSSPSLPDFGRIGATASGALTVAAMMLLRLRFAGFALHPLGYAMASSFGHIVWGSFLIVWVAKAAVLRYGGMPLYRRAVPFFLGIAFGHLAIAGIVWGLVGAVSGAAVQSYPVFFG
jgi:hypothetical protein